jgi:hypothetical protein
MKHELKRLSKDGIEAALRKAERYRLLNEAWEAESICRDVLEADPGNQQALTALLLCLTDQYESLEGADPSAARALLPKLATDYARAYYEGIICERWAKRILKRDVPGTGSMVYDWLHQAMDHFERAEKLKPSGDDSALLRWNTCARLIESDRRIRPAPAEEREPIQSE